MLPTPNTFEPAPNNSENILYSGNENNAFWKSRSGRDYCVPDIKIQKQKIKISFWIKKSRIENNTLWKILSIRDYCVPEKGVQNVILYVPHFIKDIFVFSLQENHEREIHF